MTSYQRLRLLLNSSLDANQKLVAIALSDHMSDTRGYALCGVARLALLTSLSERTVQRVLNQGDGDWLKRDMKPGAKQYPTYILWSKLPNKQATGDSASHVPDGHMCQPDACDGEAQVTDETATGDNLSADGCQTGHSQVTGCHPKPTTKPTREANQGSQPEYMSPAAPPPLFAQPPAPEAPPPAGPAPKPEPKPDALTPGELAVWQAYRLHHPTAKATPPKAHQSLLRAAVAEYGAEAVVAVVRWAHQSEGGNARFLRGENPTGTVYLGLDNLLRKEKLPGRIELAAKEEAGEVPKPKLSALPPGMKPRGPVIIDAESGRVEVQPEPRKGGKPDLFDMADWLKTIDVSAEGREGEEDHAQGN